MPWYERGLFWGCLSLAAAIVLTVIAAMQKDLRFLLILAWPFFLIPFWLMCREITSIRLRWISFLALSICATIALLWVGKIVPKPEAQIGTPSLSPPAQDLTGIEKELREINQRLAEKGRPLISASQMEAIKEVDRMIVEPDEMGLRQTFGFPSMMITNIRLYVDALIRFQRTGEKYVPFPQGEIQLDNRFSGNNIRRQGGAFMIDYDPTMVFAIWQPNEYSVSKRQLLKIENSTELPSTVIHAVKEFDSAVSQNATTLIEVLSDAMKRDHNYYLLYDDKSSSYLHALDGMYLDKFIQLRPKADKVRDAIRKFLAVK